MLAVQSPYQIFPSFQVKEAAISPLPMTCCKHRCSLVHVLGGLLPLCSGRHGRVCAVSCWDVFPSPWRGGGGWVSGHAGCSEGYLQILPCASLMSTRSPRTLSNCGLTCPAVNYSCLKSLKHGCKPQRAFCCPPAHRSMARAASAVPPAAPHCWLGGAIPGGSHQERLPCREVPFCWPC